VLTVCYLWDDQCSCMTGLQVLSLQDVGCAGLRLCRDGLAVAEQMQEMGCAALKATVAGLLAQSVA
jgi:hypothetical protein